MLCNCYMTVIQLLYNSYMTRSITCHIAVIYSCITFIQLSYNCNITCYITVI